MRCEFGKIFVLLSVDSSAIAGWWYEDPDSFYDGAVAFVRSGWEDVRS